MADKKITDLTELLSPDAAIDVLAVVDSSANETKKISLTNLPLSDTALNQSYPYTIDFQNGVEQTRNLTTITSSDGYYLTSQPSSIYIGSNVTSIGNNAFYGSILTSLTIPNSVTSIGSAAFIFCIGLLSVTIGNSVTSIGNNAFRGSSSLTSVTIGNLVNNIGSQAFYFCTSLTSITIPNSVTSIGNNAFSGSGLATINCFALAAPALGTTPFVGITATEIHVPVGATGYTASYGGLTVIADL
jgi:hypothetical protein